MKNSVIFANVLWYVLSNKNLQTIKSSWLRSQYTFYNGCILLSRNYFNDRRMHQGPILLKSVWSKKKPCLLLLPHK